MIKWIQCEKQIPTATHGMYGEREKLPGVPPEWWESDTVLVWYEDKETGDQNYGLGQIVADEDNRNPSWCGIDCEGWRDLSYNGYVIKAWMPLPEPYKEELDGR